MHHCGHEKKAATAVLPADRFFFVRVRFTARYICLGKRALFLIDFEPPFQEQFYYAWVQRVVIDADNLLLFQIDFAEGRPPLILESFERDRLCDELAICWKADSMFRQWRWMPFPKKRGQCDVAKRDRTATEVRTSPPPLTHNRPLPPREPNPAARRACERMAAASRTASSSLPNMSRSRRRPAGRSSPRPRTR